LAKQSPRLIILAALSAIIMAGALVLPPMSVGMIEASTTRGPPATHARRAAALVEALYHEPPAVHIACARPPSTRSGRPPWPKP